MRRIAAVVGLLTFLPVLVLGQVGPVAIPIRWTVTTTDTTALLGAASRWGCRRELVVPPLVAVTCDLTRAPATASLRSTSPASSWALSA